jgi:branched-chain amino acid transport system substrate-binding protein
MADRVGQRLGNYQLVRLLGEGGFAEVYLGEHIHLYTQAAIKVLHTQLTNEDIKKFSIEARNLARLIHPHIVRVLDFGVEGKTPFLVMDYAPNGTLRQRHPRGMPLPLPVVVIYVKQVADALQFAHNQKLIHRDVKPENMLLGRNNEILLSDFGIAIVAQSSRYQSTQDMAGTIAYMAPEQIQAHPRPASDQYSLGVVVYEWLTGERPFRGSFTEIAAKHTLIPPPPLREKIPTISPEVEQVVLTALAKDPKARFMTIQAFATALEQASSSTLISQRIPFIPPYQESRLPKENVPVPEFPNTSMPAPQPTIAPTFPASSSSSSPILPLQAALPSSGKPGVDRQRPTELTGQMTGTTQVLRTQKNPNFALIIGISLLLLVLVGSSILLYTNGIFPFSRNAGNNSRTPGNSNNSGGLTSNQPKTPIKIGISLPLSGDFSADGNAFQQGYQLWADTVNKNGGVLGRQVTFDILSDASSTTQVVTNYQKLITVDHCDLVFGPFSTLLTKPASVVANQYGYAFVEGAGGGPSVFTQGLHNLFDVSPPVANLLVSFTQFLLSLPTGQRPTTAAYATEDDPFTQPQVDTAKQLLEQGGVKTVSYQVYPSATTDYTPIAQKMIASNAQVIVTGTLLPDIVAYIQAFKLQHYNPQAIIATAGPDQGTSFTDAIGGSNAAEGIFVPNGGWYPSINTFQNTKMVGDYLAKYGGTADGISSDVAEAFAVGQVFQQAATKINSIDNAKLIAELHSGATYQSVQGPVKFNAQGENVLGTGYLFQWQKGSLVSVYPASQASAAPEFPKPNLP